MVHYGGLIMFLLLGLLAFVCRNKIATHVLLGIDALANLAFTICLSAAAANGEGPWALVALPVGICCLDCYCCNVANNYD